MTIKIIDTNGLEVNDVYPVIQNWRWRHNFPRKVSINYSQIRGSTIRERRKKKMNLCFSWSWPSYKAKSIVAPLIFSTGGLWCRVIWMLTFWGNCDVTSGFGSPGRHVHIGIAVLPPPGIYNIYNFWNPSEILETPLNFSKPLRTFRIPSKNFSPLPKILENPSNSFPSRRGCKRGWKSQGVPSGVLFMLRSTVSLIKVSFFFRLDRCKLWYFSIENKKNYLPILQKSACCMFSSFFHFHQRLTFVAKLYLSPHFRMLKAKVDSTEIKGVSLTSFVLLGID